MMIKDKSLKTEIKIQKRDGSFEGFDSEKITRVIRATGLDPDQAEVVVANITRWAQEQEKQKDQLSTFEIREKVIEELKKKNPHLANLFAWYENGKDRNSNS